MGRTLNKQLLLPALFLTFIIVLPQLLFAVQDDIGSAGCGNLVSLTTTNTLEMYIKGVTDATNFTFDCLAMRIVRIN